MKKINQTAIQQLKAENSINIPGTIVVGDTVNKVLGMFEKKGKSGPYYQDPKKSLPGDHVITDKDIIHVTYKLFTHSGCEKTNKKSIGPYTKPPVMADF